MMKKVRFIILFAACLLLWQCGPEPVPEPDPVDPDPAISFIGPSGIELGEEAGEGTVHFISAADWTASTGDDWLQIEPAGGSGSENIVTLTVSCSENPAETPRTGTVTLTSGSLAKTVTITQAGKPSGPKSKECELTAIRFFSSSNPSLNETLTVVPRTIRGLRILFITFPESADMANMVASFEVSKKASVLVDGIELQNGKTAVDYNDATRCTVVSEDGNHSNGFLIISRVGDPGLDQRIYDFMGDYNIPAVGLAVTKGEQLAYTAGYGLAEADEDSPVYCTANHLFRLASVSKTLTAICILTLCQEGKLNLDDKVFAPGGPLAEMFPGTHASKVDDIKIRDLLTHRSGWTNSGIGDDPIFPYTSRFYNKNLKDRVASVVKNNSPSYTPGTYYAYSNLGFCILGLVIEQVSGKSYETYLREVVAKAGANDIWLSKTPKSGKRANECVFYSQDSGYPYDNNMEIASSCGGVTASAVEMAKILTTIDYGSVTADILAKEWLDAMYTNYTSPGGKAGYGFGWWIEHYTMNNWAAYHTGSLSGTKTLWVRGNNGVNGVILCNSNSPKGSFETTMFTTLNDAMTRVKQNY